MTLDTEALKATAKAAATTVIAAEHGSGAFVDDRLVLTAAHVAGEVGTPASGTAGNGTSWAGTVVAVSPREEPGGLDAALIELDDSPRVIESVLLVGDAPPDNGRGYAAGFPSGTDQSGRTVDAPEQGRLSVVEFDYRTAARVDEGVVGIEIVAGYEVAGGLSGSAVVDEQLHAVVGVVTSNRGTSTHVRGGSAVPVASLLRDDRFAALRGLVETPPESSRQWRTKAGMIDLDRDRPRVVTIRVEDGDWSHWTISVATQQPISRVVADLGDEVGPAVFGWLQGRPPDTREGVERCQRLLHDALFVGPALERLSVDPVDPYTSVRLDLTNAPRLQDVPWELAATTLGRRPTLVATDSGLTLSRVDGRPTQPAPPVDRPGVLVIVDRGEGLDATAKRARDFANKLHTDVRPPFVADVHVVDADTPAVAMLLEDRPPLVLHYVGQVRDPDHGGDTELSYGDAPRTLRGITDLAAEFDVRLVIVQHVVDPPSGRGRLRPSMFKGHVGGSIEALVANQYAISQTHHMTFNKILYGSLAEGDTVERAVQKARQALKRVTVSAAPNAYGAFVVYSSVDDGVRLAPRQPATSGRPPAVPVEATVGARLSSPRDTARGGRRGALAAGPRFDRESERDRR